MNLRWWDEVHDTLWQIADCAQLLELRHDARIAMRNVVPLLAQARPTCDWTQEKSQVFAILDAKGLTRVFASMHNEPTMPLAMAIWEMACVDAGVATCSLSGSLAQMPIRDFGTKTQRNRYVDSGELRYGALCLTEPIPGAGADAMFIAGRMELTGTSTNGEPLLQILKRGRFISHMDFAQFVVAAVQGDGTGMRGSALVILEPGDAGDFERGESVRKLGHRFASTTDPVFRLTVPASRIVGGYMTEQGALVPRFSHRALLEPALLRMRALLGLMTAAKALSTVQDCFDSSAQCSYDVEFRLSMADLWATGEAAASLGFCAARLCDKLDGAKDRSSNDARLAAIFSPAAKLFSSSRIPECLRQAAAWSDSSAGTTADLHARLIDAQIEEMYMGPSALQRRQVSAAMTDARFLAGFERWIGELNTLARSRPRVGLRTLAQGMRLWHWTLEQLRQQVDARGAMLYCDARQGVTFAMADALCGLFAARSLALDVLEMEINRQRPEMKYASIFRDLSILASGRTAARASQTCVELLCGYAERFPVSSAERRALAQLQAGLCASMSGTMDARERIAEFLRGAGRKIASTAI
jgi:hypothetical protein